MEERGSNFEAASNTRPTAVARAQLFNIALKISVSELDSQEIFLDNFTEYYGGRPPNEYIKNPTSYTRAKFFGEVKRGRRPLKLGP